jgi:hypothetical protein
LNGIFVISPQGKHSTYQYSPENWGSLTMSVEKVSKSSFQVAEKREKREKRERLTTMYLR